MSNPSSDFVYAYKIVQNECSRIFSILYIFSVFIVYIHFFKHFAITYWKLLFSSL